MRIQYESGRGRFAVAARDIQVGELIALEHAFVALLDKVQGDLENMKFSIFFTFYMPPYNETIISCGGMELDKMYDPLHIFIFFC